MAHPDLNSLLNSMLSFAKRMLAEFGEFYPFGRTMKPNGEIVFVSAYDGKDHPPSQVLIDLLSGAFREQARNREIKAAGICCDVRTIPPGANEKCDAVSARLEHESGEAVNVFLPYQRTSDGKVEYGQIFATSRIPEFFARQAVLIRRFRSLRGFERN